MRILLSATLLCGMAELWVVSPLKAEDSLGDYVPLTTVNSGNQKASSSSHRIHRRKPHASTPVHTASTNTGPLQVTIPNRTQSKQVAPPGTAIMQTDIHYDHTQPDEDPPQVAHYLPTPVDHTLPWLRDKVEPAQEADNSDAKPEDAVAADNSVPVVVVADATATESTDKKTPPPAPVADDASQTHNGFERLMAGLFDSQKTTSETAASPAPAQEKGHFGTVLNTTTPAPAETLKADATPDAEPIRATPSEPAHDASPLVAEAAPSAAEQSTKQRSPTEQIVAQAQTEEKIISHTEQLRAATPPSAAPVIPSDTRNPDTARAVPVVPVARNAVGSDADKTEEKAMAIESPPIIIKKEVLRMTEHQPELTDNENAQQMAALEPAAGSDNPDAQMPAIQLPPVPPPVLPSKIDPPPSQADPITPADVQAVEKAAEKDKESSSSAPTSTPTEPIAPPQAAPAAVNVVTPPPATAQAPAPKAVDTTPLPPVSPPPQAASVVVNVVAPPPAAEQAPAAPKAADTTPLPPASPPPQAAPAVVNMVTPPPAAEPVPAPKAAVATPLPPSSPPPQAAPTPPPASPPPQAAPVVVNVVAPPPAAEQTPAPKVAPLPPAPTSPPPQVAPAAVNAPAPPPAPPPQQAPPVVVNVVAPPPAAEQAPAPPQTAPAATNVLKLPPVADHPPTRKTAATPPSAPATATTQAAPADVNIDDTATDEEPESAQPAAADTAPPPVKKLSGSKTAPKKKHDADDVIGNDSEPERSLSNASKKILGQIPSNIDQRNDMPSGPLKIDRATANRTVPKLDDSARDVAKHEAMGIKIEIKKPEFNSNYELEQAYNAVSSGQPTTAIGIYKNVLDNDPNNTNALFGLATLYHRAGQLDTARPLYAHLLAVDPNNREGLNNFLVLLSDEAPEAALAQLEKLELRNPQFSPIPAQMAVIYDKLGNTQKASEQMFRAIQLAPENLTYRYNLAIMLDRQKNYSEAAKLYQQIIDAYQRGASIPGNVEKIQQRLTFISSNRQ